MTVLERPVEFRVSRRQRHGENILDFVRAKLVTNSRPYHVVALHGKTIEGRRCTHRRKTTFLDHVHLIYASDSTVHALYHPSPMTLRILPHLRSPLFPQLHRGFRTTTTRDDFHFDTHHFVQRLEREGLNRAQAEGIMSAMAEVIDESIRNMTSNMVTKADHEKVRVPRLCTSCAYHRTMGFPTNSNIIHNKSTLLNSNLSSS